MGNDSDGTPPGPEELLEWAEFYLKFEWGSLPMVVVDKEKKPTCRWKGVRQQRPSTSAELRRLFLDARSGPTPDGLAVVFSASCGGTLANRDFDDPPGSYEAWAAAYPEWAANLPTAETSPGHYHVFFRTNVGPRNRNGEPCYRKQGNGEFRWGKCYAKLPPSWHHSGRCYRWLIPLDPSQRGGVPWVADPVAAGLLRPEDVDPPGQRPRPTKKVSVSPAPKKSSSKPFSLPPSSPHDSCTATAEVGGTPSPSPPLYYWCHYSPYEVENCRERIEVALRRTLPTGPNQRHTLVLSFACQLKAIEPLADLPAEAMEPVVREWWRRCVDVVDHKEWSVTWARFLNVWPIAWPAKGTLAAMRHRLDQFAPLPGGLSNKDRSEIRLRRLQCACELYAADCDGGPFPLGEEVAGQLAGVGRTLGRKLLGELQARGLLQLHRKADHKRGLASEWIYLEPMSEYLDEDRSLTAELIRRIQVNEDLLDEPDLQAALIEGVRLPDEEAP